MTQDSRRHNLRIYCLTAKQFNLSNSADLVKYQNTICTVDDRFDLVHSQEFWFWSFVSELVFIHLLNIIKLPVIEVIEY